MKPKALALSFLTAAFVFACFVNNGYSASASPAKFEQRKAQQLRRLEIRIAQMQEQRTCVSAATSQDAIKACRERFKPTKNPRQL
jgi:hypothetical protein